MTRRLNPEYLARLQREAADLESYMRQKIHQDCLDISNHVANWQPLPCPDDWVPSDVTIIEPTPQPRRLK